MAFTSANDVNILQASDSAFVGAGAGNDKYIATPVQFGASKSITISDTGANTLQLIAGLSIVSSRVASDTLQLTLSNGCTLTVLGASLFTFEIGGNPVLGTPGILQDFTEFVTTSLATTVPAAGAAAVAGTPDLVVTDTGVVPPAAVQSFTLTASTATVNEGVAVTYTLTAATAPTDDTIVTVSVVPGIGLVTDQGTDSNQGTSFTNPNDFPVGALNPKTVVIKAGETTATFEVTTLDDGRTELPESYSVKAMIGTTTVATKTTSVLDGGSGTTFALTDSTLGTAPAQLKVMHITGDQDVRIDFTTNPNKNQITGLDLNGNGTIAADGKENALNVKPSLGYGAVDAYTRLDNGVVNETNLSKVFLGDIEYDGTGFEGDGVKSDGNIVLGGLGADTILTGLGNDFIAAGGVVQSRQFEVDKVAAGRNSDFIFAELSLLSNTDGNKLLIDGGSTADDTSAANGQSPQDSDWLLLQASDDDEPVSVNLREDEVSAVLPDWEPGTNGTLETRSGQYGVLRDIENVDASGNTYGFIKGLDTTLGGAPVNTNNNGIGSSGQLRITGSEAANIIIAGYDNDAVNGVAGDDILMGGNLRSYAADGVTVAQQLLDPNLVGLVGNNDGRDELTGGAGKDNIVFEADGGIIEGGATPNQDESDNDTLWLTQNSLGAVVTATTLTPVEAAAATNPFTTDGVLRFDLGSGKQGGIDNFSGYGGAGDTDKLTSNASGTLVGYTADQTNYTNEAAHRVQVQDMESVIATGLGGVDYKAAGGNSATDVTFQNQQNFQAYNGDLDLRGTEATVSNSVIEVSPAFTTLSVTLATVGQPLVFTVVETGILQIATGLPVGTAASGLAAFDAQHPNWLPYVTNITEINPGNNVNIEVSLPQTGTPSIEPFIFPGNLTKGQAIALFLADNPELSTKVLSYAASITPAVTDTITTLTGGENTLYAAAGDDLIEGRTGNDLLSGGDGVDDFVFNLGGIGGEDSAGPGDGLDVIWRQTDDDNNNLWDTTVAGGGDGAMARISVGNQAGLMEADFGQGSSSTYSASKLTVNFAASDLAAANKFLIDFSVKIGSQTFAITEAADLATLKDATSATEVAAIVNAVFNAKDANVTATASGNVLTITDAPTASASGREMTNISVAGTVTGTGESFTNPITAFIPAGSETFKDRLIFAAYNDRADGELVDDDAVFGGDTLGSNNYAQDLVVGFNVDGSTVVAERQAFRVDLSNLAVQDAVTVTVNGVTYSLTVGRESDNTLIAGETTGAFAVRLATFINDFLDDDTAAGKVEATGVNSGNTGSITLTQAEYAREETVFMNVGVNVKDNSSNGEGALGTVINLSSTDITLYEYNGRNAGLNATNALFVGDSGVGPDGTVYSENSRAILATADNLKNADGTANLDAGGYLLGSDAIVVNVTPDVDVVSSAAEGVGAVTVNATTRVETLGTSAIFFNDAENPTTGRVDNYAVHGDDQLFGGDAADIVRAGTGDDRVYGSLGADRLDGGKDLWLVDGVIRVLNDYEATVVDALPATLSIEQIADGAFNDTLVYQQSDFGTVGVGGATFNITLDLSAEQANGGAGRVITNALAANTTLFTNMENIRTVSGNGTLAGQGNDTLDLSITVNPLTGVTAPNSANMRYYLTKEANNGGEVHMVPTVNGDANDPADLGDPSATLFTKVDGVENVLGGSGTDHLYIDQTESGKNNSFNAGTSTAGVDADPTVQAAETAANGDMIVYQNNATALTAAQLPKVVLAIGAADVDTVTMTGGQLPAGDAPVDTLTGVEFIDVDAVARNVDEADELNAAALTSGAGVYYTDGRILNGTTLVATVTGMPQLEIVTGSTANDTVFMASAAAHGTNASSDLADFAQDEEGNILIDSYLTYDTVDEAIGATLDTDTTPERMNVAALRSVTTPALAVTAAQAAIVDAINQYQFMQNLGAGAADTVDYSLTTDEIAAVVNFDTTVTTHNVFVGVDDGDLVDPGDRIDQATGVERFVASQGQSTLDLTGATQDLKITFSNNFDDTKTTSWDANFAAGKYGREVHEIKVANALSSAAIVSTSYIDYVYVDTSTTDTTTVPADARWTDIQGSDYNETVEVSAYEAGANNNLVLRGGANKVTYEGTSINAVLNVVPYVAANPTTTGLIEADITHIAVDDDHNPATVADLTIGAAFLDTISSYSQQNGIDTGTLTIKATRGAQDSFSFDPATTADKLYIFGGAVDATPSINVKVGAGATANSLELIGFELVQDSDASNDVYDIVNFASISPDLRLVDGIVTLPADHDTIKVANNVAVLDGDVNAANINLAGLRIGGAAPNNTYLSGNFATFAVLDVTSVTGTTITSVTGSLNLDDELVVGTLPGITSETLFESLILTNAFVTSYGTSVTLNTTTNTVTAGTKTLTADGFLRTVSLGGNALAGSFNLDSSLTASGNVSVTAVGPAGVTLIGGSGANTLTGADGADTLRGGQGIDILDGGFTAAKAEVHSYTLSDPAGPAGETVIINGVTVTEGVATPGDPSATIVANNDADAIGAAFVRVWNANPTNFTIDSASPAPNTIASVTYDALNNLLSFTFAAGNDPINTVLGAATGTADADNVTPLQQPAVSNETVTQAFQARLESADFYVFEATGALNGADVLNNVDASDTFNFDAFLGAGNGGGTAVASGNFATLGALIVAGTTDLVTAFNKGTLSTADFAAAATIGKFFVADATGATADTDGKVVFAVSADADGGADATQNSWNLYYVSNGATAGISDLTVTLVGTVNTTAVELTEALIGTMLV